MSRACRLLMVLAFAAWTAAAARAGALIEFPNLSDQARPEHLRGYLARPEAPGRFPAVVVLHGCRGFFSTYAAVADDLQSEGYVALAVDSLGPRSIADACDGLFPSQPFDAYAALAYLARQPFVDAERIAVLGYSLGGVTALLAVERGFIHQLFPRNFAAAIAYYPTCEGRSNDVTAPTMILIGDADDWTLSEACRKLTAQPRAGGNRLDLTVYPGAHHGFDNPKLATGVRVFGHLLEYNGPAATDAWDKMRRFLAANLRTADAPDNQALQRAR